jgi:hypothetical protein
VLCSRLSGRGVAYLIDRVVGAWVSLARRPHLINWVSGYQNDRTDVGGGSDGGIKQKGWCSGKKAF